MDIQHRPDLITYFYAELWAAEPFQAKSWYAKDRLPSQSKDDFWKIGCTYKMDVAIPCWVGWEGTIVGNRLLCMVQAEENKLDNPPAPQLKPVRRGVNILSWGVSPPDEEPIPGPEPEPEPEPPGHPPTIPDPIRLPMVTTLVGNSHTSMVKVHFWGTLETPGRELVYELPEDEYLRIYGESGLVQVLTWLRGQIEAGNYTAQWHVRG